MNLSLKHPNEHNPMFELLRTETSYIKPVRHLIINLAPTVRSSPSVYCAATTTAPKGKVAHKYCIFVFLTFTL